MTTHHIDYVKDNRTGPREPYSHELPKRLKNLDIQHGDQIIMQDGKRFGFCLQNLTDFDSILPEAYCKDIIEKCEPAYRIKTIHDSFKVAYATRKVISISGNITQQVLVCRFGDPVWLNLSTSEKIENITDQELAIFKKAYH